MFVFRSTLLHTFSGSLADLRIQFNSYSIGHSIVRELENTFHIGWICGKTYEIGNQIISEI